MKTYNRVRKAFIYDGKDLIWNISKTGNQKGSIAGGIQSNG